MVYGLPMVGRSEKPHLQGIEFAAYEPGPCIVCGNSTLTCTPEDHTIVFKNDIDTEDTFLIEEDIIEKRWISSEHLAKVLIVSAGSRISIEKAQELGLI
jgi:hypothetical protein